MQKNVLITGAAIRIGREIALDFAQCGWNVAVHYNTSKKEAEKLKSDIELMGQKCVLIQCDLNDVDKTKTIILKAHKELGELSCLINNASNFKRDEFENFDENSWNQNINANLLAPLLLAQEFAKHASTSANIINILDYSVLSVPDKFFSYNLSKAAMWNATRTLAKKLAPNIRINAIGPGHSMPNDKETMMSFTNAYQKTPLEIPSTPVEICNAIRFIISSDTMTGQIIALDGGKHLISAEYY